MSRAPVILVVAIAVLLSGLAWPSPGAPGATAGAHACCVRLKAAGCATAALSCCPAPERGRETSTPPTPSAGGVSSAPVAHAGADAALPRDPAVKALALDARALARANAPPDVLYLRHLTLLV